MSFLFSESGGLNFDRTENFSNIGLDVDWEYPKDDCEAQNYVHLLKDTRKVSGNLPPFFLVYNYLPSSFILMQELDSCKTHHHRGGKMLLTVACPAG